MFVWMSSCIRSDAIFIKILCNYVICVCNLLSKVKITVHHVKNNRPRIRPRWIILTLVIAFIFPVGHRKNYLLLYQISLPQLMLPACTPKKMFDICHMILGLHIDPFFTFIFSVNVITSISLLLLVWIAFGSVVEDDDVFILLCYFFLYDLAISFLTLFNGMTYRKSLKLTLFFSKIESWLLN